MFFLVRLFKCSQFLTFLRILAFSQKLKKKRLQKKKKKEKKTEFRTNRNFFGKILLWFYVGFHRVWSRNKSVSFFGNYAAPQFFFEKKKHTEQK